MKKVFVRSALFDEHFYAFVDSDGTLFNGGGEALHESFVIVAPLSYKHFLAVACGMAIMCLLYWVCFSPSFYSFVMSFSEA